MDLLLLLVRYIVHEVNLQRLLFILSFLTFGVGDGVTAAYMMNKVGVMHESNPIIRFIYSTGNSVIGIKIWFTFIILFLVWLLKSEDSYWTINGFLFALFVCGIMATGANLMATSGITPPSPRFIIFTYLFLVILFMILGDAMDKISSNKLKVKKGLAS